MPLIVLPQLLVCGLFVARAEMATGCDSLSDVLPLSYADHRKRGEMFQLRARNDGTVIDRRQRRVYDEGESKPACDSGYPLNHRR